VTAIDVLGRRIDSVVSSATFLFVILSMLVAGAIMFHAGLVSSAIEKSCTRAPPAESMPTK
jgi:hypothetical protein